MKDVVTVDLKSTDSALELSRLGDGEEMIHRVRVYGTGKFHQTEFSKPDDLNGGFQLSITGKDEMDEFVQAIKIAYFVIKSTPPRLHVKAE